MIAYFPQGVRYWREDRLVGAPKWVADEYYDIAGKVAAEELAEWQKQTPGQHEMLNAMLRTMLEERCKLVMRKTDRWKRRRWRSRWGSPASFCTSLRRMRELPEGVKLPHGGVMIPEKIAGRSRRLACTGRRWPTWRRTFWAKAGIAWCWIIPG